MARTARTPQTPGTTPSTDPAATAAADTAAASDGDDGAAAEPEAALTKPAKKAAPGALTAADYKNMHSSEVDATKLKKSVLCSDGWVCPDLPPVAPRA